MAWQQRGQADPRQGQAVALQHALMVRAEGSGWTFRVFNSARMAVAPVTL